MTLLHNLSRTLQRRRNSTWHALGYDTHVRHETASDWPAVADLTRNAFHRLQEARLNDAIRQQCPDYLSLVAEQHGQIIGHVMFSAASIDHAPQLKLMALAPMAVSNVLQHQGIGSALVRAGLEYCYQRGIDAVVVLGHPQYYPRFGFQPASSFNIASPWPVPDEVFMLLELSTGALQGARGTVQYQPVFDTL